MRVYGRTYDVNGNPTWQVVQTDANGLNDYVYATNLIQELKLNLGESPFWGNRGIPAEPSVVTQVAPDYYTYLIQQRYAPYFMNLVIQKVQGAKVPTYQVNITTHQGVQYEELIPV